MIRCKGLDETSWTNLPLESDAAEIDISHFGIIVIDSNGDVFHRPNFKDTKSNWKRYFIIKLLHDISVYVKNVTFKN